MKFFTHAWWMSDDDSSASFDAPFAAYREHLARVESRLPPQARMLSATPVLHDASIDSIHYECDCMLLTLMLVAYDEAFRPIDDASEFGMLVYAGVRSCVMNVPDGLHANAGVVASLSDLGYNEFDVVEGFDVFAHRMLFANGVELELTARTLRFAAKRFSIQDVYQGSVARQRREWIAEFLQRRKVS